MTQRTPEKRKAPATRQSLPPADRKALSQMAELPPPRTPPKTSTPQAFPSPTVASSLRPTTSKAVITIALPPTQAQRTDLLRNQLEALLFSSGKTMEEAQLASLTGAERETIKAALKTLQQEYASRNTALKVYNEGSQWKLLVRDEHIPLVRRIVADTELSRATMETLAVIAYHQPNVLQSKVVDLRGGNAYEQIAELERLGFVLKQKEGRSFSLRLAEKFFEYFDVEGEKGIRQLFKAIKAPEPKEQQKRLGELSVVDIPREKKEKDAKGKLGDLEVIDESEQPRHQEPQTGSDAPVHEPELQTAKLERNMEEENGFLAKIERQIDELAKRNDEIAKDPLFKVPEPPAQQPGDDQSMAQPTDGSQESQPLATLSHVSDSSPPPTDSQPAPEEPAKKATKPRKKKTE
jgi:segregation and condensation protein B